MTIIGAENAGLAQDADGNYIIAGQDGGQDPEPEQPGDEEDGQNQDDGDSQDTDTTVNGDETADGRRQITMTNRMIRRQQRII